MKEEITLSGDGYQGSGIAEGLRVQDSLKVAYGIDFRSGRVYKLSLSDGSVRFISNRGKGLLEMETPSQISLKTPNEFFVYETSLDLISRFVDDTKVEKLPGWLSHNVWLRHTYGFYWNNNLITAKVEPETY